MLLKIQAPEPQLTHLVSISLSGSSEPAVSATFPGGHKFKVEDHALRLICQTQGLSGQDGRVLSRTRHGPSF